MKRLVIYSLFVLMAATGAWGQCVGSCTSVTATLTDTSTQVWSNAIVTASLVPPFGNPGPMLNNGVPVASANNTVSANSSGVFTLSLDDNLLLAPSGLSLIHI